MLKRGRWLGKLRVGSVTKAAQQLTASHLERAQQVLDHDVLQRAGGVVARPLLDFHGHQTLR